MIKVEIFRNNCNIVKFKIYGHSGYDEIGKDIVCASVSSISQAAVLGLIHVIGVQPGIEIRDAYLECILPDVIENEVRIKVNVILDTMFIFFKEFIEQYGEYVQLIEMEV